MPIYPELTLQNQPGDADYFVGALGAYFNQKREDQKEQSKYEALIAQAAAQQGANVTKAPKGKGNMGAWNIEPKAQRYTASDLKAIREMQYKDRDDRIARVWDAYLASNEGYSATPSQQRKYYDNLVAETDAMYSGSSDSGQVPTPPATTDKSGKKSIKDLFKKDSNNSIMQAAQNPIVGAMAAPAAAAVMLNPKARKAILGGGKQIAKDFFTGAKLASKGLSGPDFVAGRAGIQAASKAPGFFARSAGGVVGPMAIPAWMMYEAANIPVDGFDPAEGFKAWYTGTFGSEQDKQKMSDEYARKIQQQMGI